MATEHSQVTTDHDQIRRWAEDRGGHPATVQGTEHAGEHAGVLRINFPGSSADEALEDIDWDTFFSKFEESQLAFVYQDETARGTESRFGKFIHRDDASPSAKSLREILTSDVIIEQVSKELHRLTGLVKEGAELRELLKSLFRPESA